MLSPALLLRLLLFAWGTSFLGLSLLYMLSDLPLLAEIAGVRHGAASLELVIALIWPAGVALGIAIVRVALRPLPGSALLMPQGSFVLYRDRALALALGTFAVLAASLCLGISALPGVEGALLWGCGFAAAGVLWIALRLIRSGLTRRIGIAFDAEGIRAPGVFEGAIPWAQVLEARIVPTSTANLPPTFLSLGLREPGACPPGARAGPVARVLGARDVGLDLSMIDGDPEQALAFVRRHLQEVAAGDPAQIPAGGSTTSPPVGGVPAGAEGAESGA